jgi:O-antigen/teichoic acid export membrane protein
MVPIQWRAWGRTAGAMGIGASAQSFNRMADIFFVGTLLSPAMTAYYRVGSQLAQLVAFGLQIGSVMLGREFAAKLARGEVKALARMVRRAAFVMSGLGAAIYVVLVVIFGHWITTAVADSPAIAPWVVALILGAGQMVSVMAGNVGLLFNMSGQHNIASRFMLQSVVINVLLNVSLIELFGLYGAATATLVSLLYWNIILSVAARKKIGLSTDLVFAVLRR